jgi:type III restriction enzyme
MALRPVTFLQEVRRRKKEQHEEKKAVAKEALELFRWRIEEDFVQKAPKEHMSPLEKVEYVRIQKDKRAQAYKALFDTLSSRGVNASTSQSIAKEMVEQKSLFKEEANKYFGITEKDLPAEALKKADVKLDLKPSELGQPVIADIVFTNIDTQTKDEITGESLSFAVSEDEIKNKFEIFAKLSSLPYAPVRSCNKIQMAIYDWFDAYLGYRDNSRLDIQRIVVCSETNQRVFHEIIEGAKARFKGERTDEINATNRKKEYLWDVPTVEYFNENYELTTTPNYSLDKCYLRNDRSQPEKDFEKLIAVSNKISWWFKNGTEKETCFALEYQDPKSKIMRAFYPDYIVCYLDSSVGIYDTKSGITAEIEETKAKSNALQSYIKQNSKTNKTVGGIVQATQAGMFVFEGENYNSDTSQKGWVRVDF